MLIAKREKDYQKNYSKNYLLMSGTSWSSFTTPEDSWCGRHVKVLDGSTVSMPDTNDNQEAYPQPSSQKAGCGFPRRKNYGFIQYHNWSSNRNNN